MILLAFTLSLAAEDVKMSGTSVFSTKKGLRGVYNEITELPFQTAETVNQFFIH